MIEALRHWSRSYFFHSLLHFWTATLGLVFAIIIFAVVWSSLVQSAGDIYRPIPATSVKPGAVSGQPCPGSRVAEAWISNDAGPMSPMNIVTIQCADGIVTSVSR